jgi:hypothetical protein
LQGNRFLAARAFQRIRCQLRWQKIDLGDAIAGSILLGGKSPLKKSPVLPPKSSSHKANYIIFTFNLSNIWGGARGNSQNTLKKPMPPAKHRSREQQREQSIDNILYSASAQSQGNFSQSSHKSHSALCERLLPHATGWERLFLREMAKLPRIGTIQRRKLEAIQRRHEEGSQRICGRCQGLAQNIDEYSYFCRNCGNCLKLDWEGGAQ